MSKNDVVVVAVVVVFKIWIRIKLFFLKKKKRFKIGHFHVDKNGLGFFLSCFSSLFQLPPFYNNFYYSPFYDNQNQNHRESQTRENQIEVNNEIFFSKRQQINLSTMFRATTGFNWFGYRAKKVTRMRRRERERENEEGEEKRRREW